VAILALCGRSLEGQVVSTPTRFTVPQRIEWAAKNAVGPKRLAGYVISSAISTASNAPPEYGPHWDGFGKRVGLRMSTGATGSMMETLVGALWNEDPRYPRAAGRPVRARAWNVVKMSFVATNQKGKIMPAYARYITIPANSFLSNAWRPDSHATTERALGRIQLSFIDRMIANAFSEFWPDLMNRIHSKPHETPIPPRVSTP
jgi:hypothetical protein